MSKEYELLMRHVERMRSLQAALTLFEWDIETEAPKDAGAFTGSFLGCLSTMYQEECVNDEVKDLLAKLTDDSTLTEAEAANVRILKKDLDQLEKIPAEEYRAFAELTASSTVVWAQARQNNDYASFAPVLRQIVDYTRRFAGYTREEGMSLYDSLLNNYEEGFTVEVLDGFFAQLRETIVPLLRKVSAKNDAIDTSPLTRTFDAKKQEAFCRYLAEYLGFDFARGVLAESEHPFTTSLHNHDVRITTHYYENAGVSAIFSVIHETGHALFEQDIEDAITLTPAGTAVPMGLHESQSRLVENRIGRSRAFWVPLYPKLVEYFPEQLKNVSLDDFVKMINKAQGSLIRTESDELTYCLHIMIRYEIEKELIDGDLKVEDIPEVWNRKYEEYLGVRPTSDAEGVLQDIHWSQGSIGYFPSYALGNAIAAQIYHRMEQDIEVETCLAEGNLSPIRGWLSDNVHHSGAVKKTRDILKEVTGEDFNPKYYTDYLTEKFSRIYEL